MLDGLNNILAEEIPFFAAVNFLILVILIFINSNYFIKFFKLITKRTWLLLFVIFVFALLLRIYIPAHQHIMYIDEPWYMEAGKNMLQTGSQGIYPKSIGWPFILALSFGIYGLSNWVAIFTNIFLGALTAVSIFLLAFSITKNQTNSLVSALVFSMLPVHIRWSASAETNISSLFFITLILFFCFLYYRYRSESLLWLSLAGLAFIGQFRPENYIFPVLFLFGCFLFDRKFIKKINITFVGLCILFILLSLPNFIQVMDFQTSTNWIESDTRGLMTGSNFSVNNLINNTLENGKFIINLGNQPVIFTFLYIFGFIIVFIKKRKVALFLIFWFVSLWLVYFSAWLQTLGGRDRFFMSFYPIMVISMVYGLDYVKEVFQESVKNNLLRKKFVPVFTIIIFLLFIPYTIQAEDMCADDAHFLETEIPEIAEKEIPQTCIIISNWPTVLRSTTNLEVYEAKDFLYSDTWAKEMLSANKCVLFYDDMSCHNDFYRYNEGEQCRLLHEKYQLALYKSYQKADETFSFYIINRKPDLSLKPVGADSLK